MRKWILPRILPALGIIFGVGVEVLDRSERFAAALIATSVLGWIALETSRYQLKYRYPSVSAIVPPFCVGMAVTLWIVCLFPWVSGRLTREPTTAEDLMQNYIQHKEINLSQLAALNDGVIGSKTIEDSTIHGPAVIWGKTMSTGTLSQIAFAGVKRGMAPFLRVNDEQLVVPGTIRIDGTVFRRCRFVNITLAGTDSQIATWIKDFGHVVPIR